MPGVFHQLFYHVVWATKHREPLMDAPLLGVVRAAIAAKCAELGCFYHEADGVADHIHVVLEVPPALALSKVIGQLKGFSSRQAGAASNEPFGWQEGYGVLTFRQSELPRVVDYVRNQRERHRLGELSPSLERVETPWDTPPAIPDVRTGRPTTRPQRLDDRTQANRSDIPGSPMNRTDR